MTPPDDRTAAFPAAAAADNTASLGGIGPDPAPPPAGVPDRLGKYRVVGVLGAGGMGVVYRAEDPVLRRTVALKVLPPRAAADPTARDRFLREARAQAAVEHDHVVPIYDVVDDAAVPFLAMPVLRGLTLADALRANPRPPLAEVVRIAREAAEGLAAAHATGLVHRDVKPGNIWLEEGRLRVKVLDFGLARAVGEADPAAPTRPDAADAHLTRTGSIVGTPAYMSPEQALGRPVDHRTDLFSLGVVLYQMATGRAPFPGHTAAEVLDAVVRVAPVPAGELAPELPPALTDLIARLLAKDPARRLPTAAAVAAELRAVELTLSVTAAPSAGPWGDLADDAPTLTETLAPARRKRGRGWLPVALAAVGLLVLAAGAAGLWVLLHAEQIATLEIDDAGAEDVAVTVTTAGGKPVRERTRERRLTLPPGRYAVEPADPDPAVKLTPGAVTLAPGGRETLTLRVDRRLVVIRKLDDGYLPDDPEWLKLFLKLPPKAQMTRFTKELQRFNPDWDGKVEFKEDGGKVVEVRVVTDHVTDLGPVRALRDLQVLCAWGSQSGRGRLTDLAPLRGLRLTGLNLGHGSPPFKNIQALRGMPLAEVYGMSLGRAADAEVFRGMSLRMFQFWCPEPVDLAVLKSFVAEGGGVQGPFRNLGGLGAHPLREIQADSAVFADPAATDIRVDHVYGHPPEALAAVGRHLRRNPYVKEINRTPPAVFWAFHDLAPRHLAPTWQVLGPSKASDDDPLDPTQDGGRLSAEALAAPVPRGAGPPLRWQQVTPDLQGAIDFGAVTGRDATAEAWLHAVVRAEEPGRAVLFVMGGTVHRVWLNGTPVLHNPSGTWHVTRQAVLVDLQAGENPVIVKSSIGGQPDYGNLSFHLHRLRPGEAPPAGIGAPPPPPKE